MKDNANQTPKSVQEICKINGLRPNDTKTVYNRKRKSQNTSEKSAEEQTFGDSEPFLHLKAKYFGSVECYTLFKEIQIEDLVYHIKNFEVISIISILIKYKTVIGIDRTFNVGSLYLTSMVFKCKRINSRATKESPLMLGPAFLHRESKLKDYSLFLGQVKTALMEKIPVDDLKTFEERIIFGSDDEKALVKAFKIVFPNSKRRLRSLYLKKNEERMQIVFLLINKFYYNLKTVE